MKAFDVITNLENVLNEQKIQLHDQEVMKIVEIYAREGGRAIIHQSSFKDEFKLVSFKHLIYDIQCKIGYLNGNNGTTEDILLTRKSIDFIRGKLSEIYFVAYYVFLMKNHVKVDHYLGKKYIEVANRHSNILQSYDEFYNLVKDAHDNCLNIKGHFKFTILDASSKD